MKRRVEEDDEDLSGDKPSGADEKKFSDELLNEGGEEPDERRDKVKTILSDQDLAYLETARLLWQIRENKDYDKWGFADFDSYIETECAFKRRKGKYLANLWQKFRVELGLEPKKLNKIGWYKATLIERVVTLDNVDEWLEKARRMTVLELQKAVTAEVGGPAPSDLKAFSVKVAPPQLENIETALGMCGTETGNPEAKGYNLDLICLEWQSNHIKGDKPAQLLLHFERLYGVKLLAMDRRYFKRVKKVAEKIILKIDAEEAAAGKAGIVKAATTPDTEVTEQATATGEKIEQLKKEAKKKKKIKKAVKKAVEAAGED